MVEGKKRGRKAVETEEGGGTRTIESNSSGIGEFPPPPPEVALLTFTTTPSPRFPHPIPKTTLLFYSPIALGMGGGNPTGVNTGSISGERN